MRINQHYTFAMSYPPVSHAAGHNFFISDNSAKRLAANHINSDIVLRIYRALKYGWSKMQPL